MKQFFDAIRTGDLESVKAQLDADASLVNAKNEQGVSAIAFSIYNRKPEITALLEERGVSHDIFTAVMAGKTDLVAEMLSGNKGLVRLMSADGWTPLHLAAFFSQTECAAILLGSGAEVTTRSTNPMQNMPLHAAVAGRNTEIVSMLVEAGAPVNARQHGGWAPLHAAAQNGDVAIAEILLGKGAEVGARADNNQAAFDLALSKGHQAMVDLLEKHGVRF